MVVTSPLYFLPMDHPALPRPRVILLATALTVTLVFLAFGRSLFQGFAPADDSFLVVHNLAAHGVNAESVRLAFTTYDPELYIPLTLVSFQLDYMAAGLQPWMYHLSNLLLHAANALLVMWLLFLMTGKKLPALLAGLLFAAHPLHTEAVAWVAGRKDLLSTFFALLSFIAYVKYRNGSRQGYAWSVVTLLLSLLAKLMAVTLPVLFLLYDFLWERRQSVTPSRANSVMVSPVEPWHAFQGNTLHAARHPSTELGMTRWTRLTMTRSLFLEKLPHFALSLVFGIVAMGGKERILAMLSPMETFLVAAKSTAFYLQKLLLPLNLGVLYPYQGEVGLLKPAFFLPLLALMALAGILLYAWRRSSAGRMGGVSFCLLFYLVALSPTLLHGRKGASVLFAVDRYAYLPSVGIALLLALLISRLLERHRSLRGEALWIPVVIVLAAAAGLSFRQTLTWDSAEALYGNVLKAYPESVDARASLASIRRKQGRITEAFEILKEGLNYGDDPRLRMHAGFVYAANGDVPSAREQFEKVMAADPKDPEPVFAIGSLLEQTGDPAGALERYEVAVDLDPSYVAARVALARLLLAGGKTDEAEVQLRSALEWNPSSMEGHMGMAKLLLKKGEEGGAAAHLRTALRIDGGNGEARRLLGD